MTPSQLTQLLRVFTSRLTAAHVDSPRLSAEVITAYSLGLERTAMLTAALMGKRIPATSMQLDMLEQRITDRANGMPVAYITGVKEFYGRDFAVTPATLIPRPETELLVDTALAFLRHQTVHSPTFADLGTGSGCIGLTVALECPHSKGLLVDLHADALKTAHHNRHTLQAHNTLLLQGDFTSALLQPQRLDLVLSNPPYISEAEYAALGKEVREFEPKTALVPIQKKTTLPASGLEHITLLMEHAANWLRPGGLLLMEIGMNQKDAVLQSIPQEDWAQTTVLRDLAGLPRLLQAIRCEKATSVKSTHAP